jgi:hypothetical protein
MANSVPKSGTHLLVQILEALPNVRNYDSFIATVPPVRFRRRSDRTLLRRIRWVVRGELVSAHLHYQPNLAEALKEHGCIVFFIYRDPRDVAVSEAHYLTHMNRWHRAHGYFARRLTSMDERIMASIHGIPSSEVPFDFPSIADRFAEYQGWLSRESVCAVRFEDVVGRGRERAVESIVSFFCQRAGYDGDRPRLLARLIESIRPERSRTFRLGMVGGWREVFSDAHCEAMKRVAGDLLIRLGYEADSGW